MRIWRLVEFFHSEKGGIALLNPLNLKAFHVPAGVGIGEDFFGGESGGSSRAVDAPFHALPIGGDGVLVGGDGKEIEYFIKFCKNSELNAENLDAIN